MGLFFKLLLMSRLVLLLALLGLAACSPPTSGPPPQTATKPPAPATEVALTLRSCVLSNKDFAYAIDSCNCGDSYATYDTIAVELLPADGGDIQGRVLRIGYPACDSSYVLEMRHQNRYYISSMGPDPVLTDWLLYTSPVKTIRFDHRRKGFPIDPVPEIEQERFPKFDTLSFYRAYQRAVGDNLHSKAVPGIAKGALNREYQASKAHVRELLELSGVELHRVILVLKKGDRVEKVLLFNYGHFG